MPCPPWPLWIDVKALPFLLRSSLPEAGLNFAGKCLFKFDGYTTGGAWTFACVALILRPLACRNKSVQEAQTARTQPPSPAGRLLRQLSAVFALRLAAIPPARITQRHFETQITWRVTPIGLCVTGCVSRLSLLLPHLKAAAVLWMKTTPAFRARRRSSPPCEHCPYPNANHRVVHQNS